MRILVYGINYFPELTGIGKYTGEMCEWLAAKGHQVEVVTAFPYYPQWKVVKEYKGKAWHQEQVKGVKVVRNPLFVTQHVTSLTRIIHEISFLLSSFFSWLPRFFRKYDVVISVYPPLIIGIYPFLYWLLRRPLWVFHVQDLQVDAAKELGLIRNKMILKLLEKMERLFLKKASLVTSISKGMKRRLLAKGVKEENYFPLPNWADLSFIKPVERNNALKAELGFKPEDRIILYSGNMGEKQGLEIILQVAERMAAEKNIHFVFCGEGAAKSKLNKTVKEKSLSNVTFISLQPYRKLPCLLSMADLHLVLQKKAASDLVLPSKYMSILAVGGVAVISSEKGSTLEQIVSDNEVGILIEPENEEQLYNAIAGQIHSDKSGISSRARTFAEKHLNKDIILTNFEFELKQLLAKEKRR